MKHTFLFTTMLCWFTLFFTGCEPNTPEPIQNSYPKKQLLEEFVGQGCGYCPYGLDAIQAAIGNDTSFVAITHHYGYKSDNFSVDGSRVITNALKVSGTPNISINRSKTQYTDEEGRSISALVFHPAYLENTRFAQFADSTYASIRIKNQYKASTRQLTVTVNGVVARTDVPDLWLTVLVKESGMIDTQADYIHTTRGWKEFRHTNAVRAFLTEPKGDYVRIIDRRYSFRFTLTLDEQWIPENCMVVAFLSEDFQPVVQAEQRPVVTGTSGGADIVHGGITPYK